MCMPFKGRDFSISTCYSRIGAGAKDHLEWCDKGLRHPGWKEPRPCVMKLPFSYRPLTLKLYREMKICPITISLV